MYRLKLTGTILDTLYKKWFRDNNWDKKDLFVCCDPFSYSVEESYFSLRHKDQTTEYIVHKSMFEPVPPSKNLEDYL